MEIYVVKLILSHKLLNHNYGNMSKITIPYNSIYNEFYWREYILKNREWSIKFQLIVYLFVTFLFSWIAWGILYASDRSIISRNIIDNHLLLFIGIGGFMPSIMSIFFSGFFYGIDGIKELMKKLTIWKVNPLFYLFVLFCNILSIYYIPLWICNITGSSLKLDIPIKFYYIIWIFLTTIPLGGPLGEELGWRGFVLPRLQSKLNPICSGILLGIIWASWHIPLFFIHGSSQCGAPFTAFIIQDIYLSLLFTWVYNRTYGSLILPILFHTAFNTMGSLISCFRPSWLFIPDLKFTVISNIIQILVLVFVLSDMVRTEKKSVAITINGSF